MRGGCEERVERGSEKRGHGEGNEEGKKGREKRDHGTEETESREDRGETSRGKAKQAWEKGRDRERDAEQGRRGAEMGEMQKWRR
jgi:hypothetical protein